MVERWGLRWEELGDEGHEDQRRASPPSPAPDPLRDALQVLGGAGTVEVRIETDEGIAGRGDVYFGRIVGGPETLAALVERELAPVALGTDPTMVRATHEAMLRETEYHGSFGLPLPL